MTATDTVMCDACTFLTHEPTTCEHGKTLCPACAEFYPCHLCQREARHDA